MPELLDFEEPIAVLLKEIEALGGKIEGTQKMDKRPFSRVADKRNSSGHYVNVIFTSQPSALIALDQKQYSIVCCNK